MRRTLDILVLSTLAITMSQVTGCAGGREKQAVTVQPAPGSNSGSNGEQQGATPQGEQQGPAGEPETQQGQDNGGEKTDLQIDTELDNGDGSTTPGTTPTTGAGPWDGKSFKGSGKWKVTPVN
jgi:hypothetical protein